MPIHCSCCHNSCAAKLAITCDNTFLVWVQVRGKTSRRGSGYALCRGSHSAVLEVYTWRGNGGTEMENTLHDLQQRFLEGPPSDAQQAEQKHLYYLQLGEEVEDFLSVLKNRYWAYQSTTEEEKQPYTGEQCTQGDRPLFLQAVDLHQKVVNKITYWMQMHRYGYANQHTKTIPSRQMYNATDARMPRYGYGFK